MAKFKFYLNDKGSEEPTQVFLYVRYAKNTVKFYTRETIHPDLWDSATQRAKQLKRFPEYPEFNTRLDKLEATAKNLYREYQNDHDHQEPPPSEFKKILEDAVRGTVQGYPTHLIDYVAYRAEYFKGIGKKYQYLDYKYLQQALKDFSADKKTPVDFSTMDGAFFADYVKYLETPRTVDWEKGRPNYYERPNKYGLSKNSIVQNIRKLKAVLNDAASPEIGVNKFHYYKRFKVTGEEPEAIYLDEKDLDALYKIDLSGDRRLDVTRDLFLLGCWTGLRYSDFSKLSSDDVQGGYIHILTQKTKKKVVIPVHYTVKSILDKYNGTPPTRGINAINANLKLLAAKIDRLKEKAEITKTIGGIKITKMCRKCDVISSHAARRSFATNMFLAKVQPITIMAITGHKTEKAFLRYIRVTPSEHAEILMGYFQKLRVV